MSDNEDDIIKKYELNDESFVATEEDLQKILDISKEEKTVYQDVADTLEISPNTEKHIAQVVDTSNLSSDSNDLDNDYKYIRTNLYNITEKSITALENLVDIADQSQHPRAYEVVSLLVNTIANAQKDLMSIHKEKTKIEIEAGKASSPDVVNNNLFVGNTAELDEIIAKMNKKIDSE